MRALILDCFYVFQIGSGVNFSVGTELDSIQLSIFSHRFMSTAEQMGRFDFYSIYCLSVFKPLSHFVIVL